MNNDDGYDDLGTIIGGVLIGGALIIVMPNRNLD